MMVKFVVVNARVNALCCSLHREETDPHRATATGHILLSAQRGAARSAIVAGRAGKRAVKPLSCGSARRRSSVGSQFRPWHTPHAAPRFEFHRIGGMGGDQRRQAGEGHILAPAHQRIGRRSSENRGEDRQCGRAGRRSRAALHGARGERRRRPPPQLRRSGPDRLRSRCRQSPLRQQRQGRPATPVVSPATNRPGTDERIHWSCVAAHPPARPAARMATPAIRGSADCGTKPKHSPTASQATRRSPTTTASTWSLAQHGIDPDAEPHRHAVTA